MGKGSASRCALAAMVALTAAAASQGAGAAVTTVDQHGPTLVDGRKVFPIVLAKGPEPTGKTPGGGNALDEVVAAGVNFFKVGPAATAWSLADKDDALAWNRAAAARGVHTWVRGALV